MQHCNLTSHLQLHLLQRPQGKWVRTAFHPRVPTALTGVEGQEGVQLSSKFRAAGGHMKEKLTLVLHMNPFALYGKPWALDPHNIKDMQARWDDHSSSFGPSILESDDETERNGKQEVTVTEKLKEEWSRCC